MAADHAALHAARDRKLRDGAQAGRIRVQAFVDMEIEREPVVLREVEHAPELVHDAFVAIDEGAEHAARALHRARDALAGRAFGEQVERHERDELQLDAAAPLLAQRLEDRERGRRLGTRPSPGGCAAHACRHARPRRSARSMRVRNASPVQPARCSAMRSRAAKRLPSAAPTSRTV